MGRHPRCNKRAAAIPIDALERRPVLDTVVGGTPIVLFKPPGENAVMAYERRVGERTLTFEQVQQKDARLVVRDKESGSTWEWETGECVQGPFEGKLLRRVPGMLVYWGIWARFHPETRIVR